MLYTAHSSHSQIGGCGAIDPLATRAWRTGSSDTVETSIEELRGFIGELAELVQRFNAVHAAATTSRPGGS